MVTFSYEKLKKIIFPILALPFMIFSIGWLQWYWAVVAIGAILWCIYQGAFSKKNKDDFEIKISKWVLVAVILLALFWVWQSGMGGFWAQSKDYPWRNAIFRDIVLFDWPVKYEIYDGALVYYISFWLVPAVFGKLAILLGANSVVAFQVASVAIFIWAFILILLLFLSLITLFKADSKKKQILVVIGFILFSGLDILGSIEPLGANLYHIEWWAENYQYSSMTTCLFWVFNQSVIPWICMSCLLQEKSIQNYVFLGMICFFSGPMPFLVMFLYCMVLGIKECLVCIKDKKMKSFWSDVLSLSNMLAVFFIFPFIASYFLTNLGITGGAALRIDATPLEEITDAQASYDFSIITNYILFVLFEFGIYATLVIRKNYKNILFWTTVLCLLICPFLKIGYGPDFPMRASIPAIFILFVLVYRFVIDEKGCIKEKGSNNRMLYILLIICLVLGSVTPAVEFYRGARQVYLQGLDNPMEDYIYTFSGDGPMVYEEVTAHTYGNFVAANPDEHFFFKFFAK